MGVDYRARRDRQECLSHLESKRMNRRKLAYLQGLSQLKKRNLTRKSNKILAIRPSLYIVQRYGDAEPDHSR